MDAAADGPGAVHCLFGRLRDGIWQYDHVWVVALDEHERETALEPLDPAAWDRHRAPVALRRMAAAGDASDRIRVEHIRVAANEWRSPRAG